MYSNNSQGTEPSEIILRVRSSLIQYHGLVWPADVWPAQDIELRVTSNYFAYEISKKLHRKSKSNVNVEDYRL